MAWSRPASPASYLAGLDGAQAVLVTLAYRLASYWLPLLSGPFAYLVFKRRYHDPHAPPAVAAGSSSG